MKKAKKRAIVLGETALTELAADESVEVGAGFKATVNGLQILGKPKFSQWEAAGKLLRVIERGAQFALGDFILQAEQRMGERASQIIDYSSGWSEKTCANYRWLASRIAAADRRMDRLGIRHHQLVAGLGAAKQRHWLSKASADGEEHPWTVARLKKAMESGDDLPVTGWYVLVKTIGEEAQASLVDELTSKGYECKAIQKRKKEVKVEVAA